MCNEKDEFAVYYRKPVILVLLVLMLACTTISIALVIQPYFHKMVETPLDVVFRIVFGGVSVLLFGYISLFCLRSLRSVHPVLIVSERGIYDGGGEITVGWIEWDEIQQIYISQKGINRLLVIEPKDTKSFLSRFNMYGRIILTTRKQVFGSLCWINALVLATPLDEIVKQICIRRSDLFKEH